MKHAKPRQLLNYMQYTERERASIIFLRRSNKTERGRNHKKCIAGSKGETSLSTIIMKILREKSYQNCIETKRAKIVKDKENEIYL